MQKKIFHYWYRHYNNTPIKWVLSQYYYYLNNFVTIPLLKNNFDLSGQQIIYIIKRDNNLKIWFLDIYNSI